MSLNDTMIALEAEILSVLEGMKSVGVLPYFKNTGKGRLKPVNEFPCAFFWSEDNIPMGNDYITGDLIRQKYTVAGFDYSIEIMGDYDLAEARSRKIGTDLRDEFTKWENRNLNGTVFQSQVTKVYMDPGASPFFVSEGGLMAAGGIEILVVYRQNRGA